MGVKLVWNGDKKKKDINEGTIRALTRSINLVDGQAKLNTPVDTGLLKSSNKSNVDKRKLIATETNNTEYALWVHEGTRYQKAQPFMRDALFDNKDYINRVFIEEGAKAVDK